jgi:hypothetical protein
MHINHELKMPYKNPQSNLASDKILAFCLGLIPDTEIPALINALSSTDLLAVNNYGQTLFLETISLSKYHSNARCAWILTLLADRATRVSHDTINVLDHLLFTPDSKLKSPLYYLLNIDSTRMISHPVEYQRYYVGRVCFDLLFSQPIARIAQMVPPSKHMVHAAFMCKNEQMRNNFLELVIYKPLEFKLLDPGVLFHSLIDSNEKGFRLIDKLIINASTTNFVAFLAMLRRLFTEMLPNPTLHVTILTSHDLAYRGFSPLHELIRATEILKIQAYVNELIAVSPKDFKSALMKRNSRGFTALQQAVNNGMNTTGASYEIAKFMLDLVAAPLFSLNEQHMIFCNHQHRLACQNTKSNSVEINRYIALKQQQLLLPSSDATSSNAAAPSSTFRYATAQRGTVLWEPAPDAPPAAPSSYLHRGPST